MKTYPRFNSAELSSEDRSFVSSLFRNSTHLRPYRTEDNDREPCDRPLVSRLGALWPVVN